MHAGNNSRAVIVSLSHPFRCRITGLDVRELAALQRELLLLLLARSATDKREGPEDRRGLAPRHGGVAGGGVGNGPPYPFGVHGMSRCRIPR